MIPGVANGGAHLEPFEGIDPFEPTVDGADSPMRPNLPKERAMGHFLDSGIYWGGAVGGSARLPSRVHRVCMQDAAGYVK